MHDVRASTQSDAEDMIDKQACSVLIMALRHGNVSGVIMECIGVSI